MQSNPANKYIFTMQKTTWSMCEICLKSTMFKVNNDKKQQSDVTKVDLEQSQVPS